MLCFQMAVSTPVTLPTYGLSVCSCVQHLPMCTGGAIAGASGHMAGMCAVTQPTWSSLPAMAAVPGVCGLQHIPGLTVTPQGLHHPAQHQVHPAAVHPHHPHHHQSMAGVAPHPVLQHQHHPTSAPTVPSHHHPAHPAHPHHHHHHQTQSHRVAAHQQPPHVPTTTQLMPAPRLQVRKHLYFIVLSEIVPCMNLC